MGNLEIYNVNDIVVDNNGRIGRIIREGRVMNYSPNAINYLIDFGSWAEIVFDTGFLKRVDQRKKEIWDYNTAFEKLNNDNLNMFNNLANSRFTTTNGKENKKFANKNDIKLIFINDKKRQVGIKWNDGTITKATCHEEDVFDINVGFAIAFTRKMFGSDKKLGKFVEEKLPTEQKESKQDKENGNKLAYLEDALGSVAKGLREAKEKVEK